MIARVIEVKFSDYQTRFIDLYDVTYKAIFYNTIITKKEKIESLEKANDLLNKIRII